MSCREYNYDYWFFDRYENSEDKFYKITRMNCVKRKNFGDSKNSEIKVKDLGTNVNKLDKSLIRTKRNIFSLAFCNDWDYFITLTLSSEKLNRKDISGFRLKFAQWMRDKKRRKGIDIKYLIVPELHRDLKNWHAHGFVMGVPAEDLHEFKIGDTFGKHIANKINEGKSVYNWISYSKRFGFCDLEPIESRQKAANYCTKYITKDMTRCISDLDKHVYFASQGLKKFERIKEGFSNNKDLSKFLDKICMQNDMYKNDYCNVWIIRSDYHDITFEKIKESLVYMP